MMPINLPQFIVHQNLADACRAVALRIATLAAHSIAARGVCRIALAGGETPRRCYELLRELPLDWAHIEFYFGDERCLPAGDAQRNDRMAAEVLFNHIAIPAANIHRIPAQQSAVAAAAEYAQTLHDALPLDVVLLGMGEDGHTASLFPGNPAVASDDGVVAVFDAPKPPPERVSLGLNTLNTARHKLFLVTGAGKRDALQQIVDGAPLPAAQITDAEWYVDQAALPAALL